MECNEVKISNSDVRVKAREIIKRNFLKIFPILFILYFFAHFIDMLDAQHALWSFSQRVTYELNEITIIHTTGDSNGFKIIAILASMVLGLITTLVISGIEFSSAKSVETGEDIETSDIFGLITGKFMGLGRTLSGQIAMFIFIGLWTLLLVIPGIIKSFAYAVTLYVMFLDRNISATDALRVSSKHMEGYKLEYFLVTLMYVIGFSVIENIFANIMSSIYERSIDMAYLLDMPSEFFYDYLQSNMKYIVDGLRSISETEAVLMTINIKSIIYLLFKASFTALRNIVIYITVGAFVKMRIFPNTQLFSPNIEGYEEIKESPDYI